MFIRPFLVLIFAISFQASFVYAGAFVEVVTEHTLQTEDGVHTFHLRRYTNGNGELELEVIHREHPNLPLFASEFDVPVLYARDISGKGRLDMWCMMTSEGSLETLDRKSSQPDGWDVASSLLLNELHIKNRNLFKEALLSAGGMFSPQTNHAHAFFTELAKVELDLHDIGTRVDRLRKVNINAGSLMYTYDYLGRAWKATSDRITLEATVKQAIDGIAALFMAKLGSFAAGRGDMYYKNFVAPQILKLSPMAHKALEMMSEKVATYGYSFVANKLIFQPTEKRLDESFDNFLASFYNVGGSDKVNPMRRVGYIVQGFMAKDAFSAIMASSVNSQIAQLTIPGQLPKSFFKNLNQLKHSAIESPEAQYDHHLIPVGVNVIDDESLLAAIQLSLGVKGTLFGFMKFEDTGSMTYLVPGKKPVPRRGAVVMSDRKLISALQFFDSFGVYPAEIQFKLLGYASVIQLKKHSKHAGKSAVNPYELRWVPVVGPGTRSSLASEASFL